MEGRRHHPSLPRWLPFSSPPAGLPFSAFNSRTSGAPVRRWIRSPSPGYRLEQPATLEVKARVLMRRPLSSSARPCGKPTSRRRSLCTAASPPPDSGRCKSWSWYMLGKMTAAVGSSPSPYVVLGNPPRVSDLYILSTSPGEAGQIQWAWAGQFGPLIGGNYYSYSEIYRTVGGH